VPATKSNLETEQPRKRSRKTIQISPVRRLVSETELEEITGIPRKTWQKRRLFNREPRYYKIGEGRAGAIRYDLSEVLEWIRSKASDGGHAA
jgi:predicted DNA-binding transcriptional regulator AlpA